MLPLRLSSQDWCAFTNRPSGLTIDLSFQKTCMGEEMSSLSPAGFAHHAAPTPAGLFQPLTPTLRAPAKPSGVYRDMRYAVDLRHPLQAPCGGDGSS
jgi:hypothetical protein